MSSKNLIDTWLNELASEEDNAAKIENIAKITEYFLDQKDPPLEITHFLKLLSYSSDINSDVRESIAGFIEEASKKFPGKIPMMLRPLIGLVSDEVPMVSKRGIRASSSVLKIAYNWIADTSELKTIEEVWNHLNSLKTQIIDMIDSENEGVGMQAIKFIESVVILQTYLDPELPKTPDDFSLDDLQFTLQINCCHKLEEEACALVDMLIDRVQSPCITSIRLMTSMGSLGRIAKLRKKFNAKVSDVITRFKKNLPPTLSASQILSIGKESQRLLETLKSAIKIKQEPVTNFTRGNPPAKRPLEQQNADPMRKKLKTLPKFEISEDWIAQNLTVDTAVELVIDAMARVPSTMTADEFAKTYPGFSVPGDPEKQRRLIAKSLVTQLKINQPKQEILLPADEPDNDQIDSEFIKLTLENNVPSLSSAAKQKMLLRSIDRIISSENSILPWQDMSNKMKILLRMATINPEIKNLILIYVSQDLKKRLDLALGLVYEEYTLNHGFKRKIITGIQEAPFQAYNHLLTSIVSMMDSHPDREFLLTRFYLAVPVISKSMIASLTSEVVPETLTLLKELIFRRPTNKLEFLEVLLGLTVHQNSSISDAAVGIVLSLYSHGEFRESISERLNANLKFLRLKNPPEVLVGNNLEQSWSDSVVESCLKLYQALLKEDKSLIDQLVQIYPSMTADVRKPVKKIMESSIRCFRANSPELLKIVETCPKGAACLVTRFVHILTENEIPSSELVAKVRRVYEMCSLDVVFLIPVLRGLSREEIFPILPKLVTRNTNVTKKVIKRLFFGVDSQTLEPLITPAEFLVAVHNFKTDVADLKTVMICISLCLVEKNIFTQEVLQNVVSRLLDQTPLPIILMRTVIQTLLLYPKMEKFVLGVLQKLILKKVWEHPKLWQGFAKCCEMLKERSFAVIHQLPQETIDDLLKAVPGLKNDYIDYLKPKNYCAGDNNDGNCSSKAVPFVSIV